MSLYRIVTRHNGEIVVDELMPEAYIAVGYSGYTRPEYWRTHQEEVCTYGSRETVVITKNWRGKVVGKTSTVSPNELIESRFVDRVFKSKAEAKRYIDEQLKNSKESKTIEEYP